MGQITRQEFRRHKYKAELQMKTAAIQHQTF